MNRIVFFWLLGLAPFFTQNGFSGQQGSCWDMKYELLNPEHNVVFDVETYLARCTVVEANAENSPALKGPKFKAKTADLCFAKVRNLIYHRRDNPDRKHRWILYGTINGNQDKPFLKSFRRIKRGHFSFNEGWPKPKPRLIDLITEVSVAGRAYTNNKLEYDHQTHSLSFVADRPSKFSFSGPPHDWDFRLSCTEASVSDPQFPSAGLRQVRQSVPLDGVETKLGQHIQHKSGQSGYLQRILQIGKAYFLRMLPETPPFETRNGTAFDFKSIPAWDLKKGPPGRPITESDVEEIDGLNGRKGWRCLRLTEEGTPQGDPHRVDFQLDEFDLHVDVRQTSQVPATLHRYELNNRGTWEEKTPRKPKRHWTPLTWHWSPTKNDARPKVPLWGVYKTSPAVFLACSHTQLLEKDPVS